MTDYSVNDSAEFGGNVGHTSKIDGRRHGDYEKAVAVAEALARSIQEWFKMGTTDHDESRPTESDAIHLMQFSHCTKCTLDSPILNAMRDVALSQGIVFIDARHMQSEAGRLWPWYPGGNHPNYKSHQVLADIASFAVLKEGLRPDCKNSTPASMTKPELLDQLPRCDKPKSLYNANNMFSSPSSADANITTKGDFRLVEDRTNKPGWVSEGIGSSVTFEVSFGAVPSLTLMYLRSYEHMGDFEVHLNGIRYALHGAWEKNISTVQVFTCQAYYNGPLQTDKENVNDEEHFGMIGFKVAAFSRHNLTITNLSTAAAPADKKVKIVSVMTC